MVEFKKIGVIGAGQMGKGIAQVCAQAGSEVVIADASEDARNGAASAIDASLSRQVARGKLDDAVREATLAKLSTADTLAGLADCDLVIEAATENEAIKVKIFEEMCATLNKDAVVCTNTSSISVTRLGSQTDRPTQFMGMHFMNPVPVMQLVELIRGIPTAPETFDRVSRYTGELGKTATHSEDFPAFMVNRILVPMINEAVYTLYEGVGGVEAIDNSLKLGANHPMGPLQLGDFIGLDTCLAIMQVLHEGLADSKYRPCPLLVKYVEAGWLGQKSGRGFYDYSGDKPVPTR